MQSSFLEKPIKLWKRWGAWLHEEPAARLAHSRDKKTTFKEARKCWPLMNVGTSQVWRKGTAEIEQFHSYKQKSLSLFWLQTSDKLRLAIFTLPTATEWSSVRHSRGPMCLEWLSVCLLWVSIFWETKWLKSGSLKVSPHPTPHMTGVKMDGMATVMNARSDRWMNGLTWWLDNRNYPQDWRSKCWWGPHNWVWCRTF